MTVHILVIEDERDIREMITVALEQHDYAVLGAESASQARERMADQPVDLALVDWMLPGGSGLELVRTLRKDDVTRSLPILMLTARTEEHDIIAGLDAGADDYLTKPFSPREMRSRVKALLRRSSDFDNDARLTRGRLSIDTAAHRVLADGTAVSLGHTEYKLLHFFMKHPDRVFSRSQLLDHVWGRGTFIEERTVDVHILRLRKSLKPHGLESMLQTVRGAGYRLMAD